MNAPGSGVVSTRRRIRALGGEVMSVTNSIERLLQDVTGEAAAIADLAGCVDRIHRAQAAMEALAHVPARDVRAALEARRAQAEENPR